MKTILNALWKCLVWSPALKPDCCEAIILSVQAPVQFVVNDALHGFTHTHTVKLVGWDISDFYMFLVLFRIEVSTFQICDTCLFPSWEHLQFVECCIISSNISFVLFMALGISSLCLIAFFRSSIVVSCIIDSWGWTDVFLPSWFPLAAYCNAHVAFVCIVLWKCICSEHSADGPVDIFCAKSGEILVYRRNE